MPDTKIHDEIEIRLFADTDLEAVTKLDKAITGRERRSFLARYCWSAERTDRITLSFVAVHDGQIVGYVLGGVYRGEFGAMDPLAILETLGIHPDVKRRGVAHALFASVADHARRLDVSHIRTLVAWNQYDLLSFFEAMGMRPTGLLPLSVNIDRVTPLPPMDEEVLGLHDLG